MLRYIGFIICWLSCAIAWAQNNTILVLGDSLSAGYGIQTEQGWVHLLQQRIDAKQLPYQVVNASVSGDTTSSALARLPKALAEHQPQIVIVELGGNDGLRALPLFTIKRNLNEIIERIQAYDAQVLLLGVRLPPNYGPAYTEQFQQLFIDVAEDNDVPIVPLFLLNIAENRDLMQDDGIHPTAKAQPIMLDNVWKELEPLID